MLSSPELLLCNFALYTEAMCNESSKIYLLGNNSYILLMDAVECLFLSHIRRSKTDLQTLWFP